VQLFLLGALGLRRLQRPPRHRAAPSPGNLPLLASHPFSVNEKAAAGLLWIVVAALAGVWVLLYLVLRLPGSYMHVFLVAAIGAAIMNLIAHYFTRPERD